MNYSGSYSIATAGAERGLPLRRNLSVLIIEDNAHLAANLFDYLEGCGHIPDAAPDGPSGLQLASSNHYDAIVLDWNLPRMDGLTVLQNLRSSLNKQIPVVMLTARDQLGDKLKGFESGLDDYLVKPIALPELEIRLRSLVHRRNSSGDSADLLKVGDLEFNLKSLLVSHSGRPIPLAQTGRKLLELLMRESPNVVSRSRLEQAAWGDSIPRTDLLRSHMHLLRRAINQNSTPPLLHTVSGSGYKLL